MDSVLRHGIPEVNPIAIIFVHLVGDVSLKGEIIFIISHVWFAGVHIRFINILQQIAGKLCPPAPSRLVQMTR